MKISITAVIITKNEALNIEKCLDSITGIVNEIIVLDAFSTDHTPEICRRYPSVKFVQRPWEGYAASKNYANELATSSYILSLDADEMLSEALKASITAIKNEENADVAFQCNRLNHIAHQPIHHSGWYPDKKVRLFPKKTSKWTGDFVHEKLHTTTNVQHIKGDLLHFTCTTFDQMENKQRQYAEIGAYELINKGKQAYTLVRLLKVFYKFFSIYCLKLGFLDGYHGYRIAFISAKYLNLKFLMLKRFQEKKVLDYQLKY